MVHYTYANGKLSPHPTHYGGDHAELWVHEGTERCRSSACAAQAQAPWGRSSGAFLFRGRVARVLRHGEIRVRVKRSAQEG